MKKQSIINVKDCKFKFSLRHPVWIFKSNWNFFSHEIPQTWGIVRVVHNNQGVVTAVIHCLLIGGLTPHRHLQYRKLTYTITCLLYSMKMSEMVPSDWLCLSVWLTVFASIVPTMGLTTLRGLAGTEVESKLYTDSLSAWYVTLTSSPLDFLFSLFYRTEDCSKIILKTCVFPSACKITYFCVLVRFFTLTFC